MDPRFLDADWSITRREYPQGVWGINQMGPAWTTLEKNIQELAVAAASFYERIPRKEEFKIFSAVKCKLDRITTP